MTITTTNNRQQFTGPGATLSYTLPVFKQNGSDLYVVIVDTSTGNAFFPVLGGAGTYDYTITGSYNATLARYPSGVTITLNNALPNSSWRAAVECRPVREQQEPFGDAGEFNQRLFETTLDRLVVMVQDLTGRSASSLRAPEVDVSPQLVLPAGSVRANKFVAFDALGNILASAGTVGSVPASAFGETLVQAAAAAAARTILGLGSLATASSVSLAGAEVTGVAPIAKGGTALTALETTVAAAATIDLGAQLAPTVNVTGSGFNTTSFGTAPAGTTRRVVFSGAGTLTHNATSLILPGNANTPVTAGDNIIALSLGSGNWRVTEVNRATGSGITLMPVRTPGAVTTDTQTGIPSGVRRVTINLSQLGKGGGTSDFAVRVGPVGGVATAGYTSIGWRSLSGAVVNTTDVFNANIPWTNGQLSGQIVLNLVDQTNNIWTLTGMLNSGGGAVCFMAGRIALSGPLERVMLENSGGTPGNFSSGSWQVSYE